MPRAVGIYLSKARQAAGFTCASLAKKLNVNTDEVKWWEESGHIPDPALLPLVSDILGISVESVQMMSGWVPQKESERHENRIDVSTLGESAIIEDAAINKKTTTNPVMTTELGKLYRADCLDLLPNLEPRSIDCIFADPPFNLGKDYGHKVKDDRSEQDYLNWCYLWLDELIRIVKPGGSLFLYNLPKWNIHLAAYLDRYLEFKHWISVDIKFSLPISGRLYPSHYSLLYFIKGPRPRVFNPPRLPLQTCRHCGGEIKDYGGYKDKMNPSGVNLTDVWIDIPPVRHKRYKNRGANELALKMLDRVLDISTEANDLVLDPFAGSGTTLSACEIRKRRWIGIEIGDCKPIIDRFSTIEEERQQLARIRSQINVLFTPEALALRSKNGHDSSRYRLLGEEGEANKIDARDDVGQMKLFKKGKIENQKS